jgi:hypothetical protein
MLADEVLAAMVAHENAKPRNQQIHLGPSELGGCREYIRNVLAGAPQQDNSEWPAAAVMGTLWGDYVEQVVADHLGAQTQVPVTTLLPNGIRVSGTADMVWPERNLLADGKTKDRLADVRKDGASLENCIQVSIYTLGLVQAGVLTEGATAVLLYCDRSGNEQVLFQIELDWEQIEHYIQVVCDRLDDVMLAQEHIDAGEVEWARALRDKTPPFCYSERVMCPFRDLCWQGSEWVPDETITDENVIATVARFVAARADVAEAVSRKEFYRKELVGVSGMTPDGYSVTWPGDGRALYVTKVRKGK